VSHRLDRTVSALATLVAIALPSARAQDTSRVAPGDDVRVTAPSLHWKRWPGSFVGFRGDSVVLRSATPSDSVNVVAFSVVKRFEVNHGNQPPRSWTKEYLILGTGVGLVFGISYGVAGAILYPCDEDQWWICNPWHVVGSFTLLGAALGGISGALTHAPPYRSVPLKPRAEVALLPGGRMGIGIRLHFAP
jgi:hypothetical protein